MIVIMLLKISRLYSCVSYPKPKPGGDAVSGCKQQVEVAECSERLPAPQGGRSSQDECTTPLHQTQALNGQGIYYTI